MPHQATAVTIVRARGKTFCLAAGDVLMDNGYTFTVLNGTMRYISDADLKRQDEFAEQFMAASWKLCPPLGWFDDRGAEWGHDDER